MTDLQRLIFSTLWCEPHHVRLLFVTLTMLADDARCVRKPKAEVETLARIEWRLEAEPDPWARLILGGWIEAIPGGWQIHKENL